MPNGTYGGQGKVVDSVTWPTALLFVALGHFGGSDGVVASKVSHGKSGALVRAAFSEAIAMINSSAQCNLCRLVEAAGKRLQQLLCQTP
jgi:hypothetical protein